MCSSNLQDKGLLFWKEPWITIFLREEITITPTQLPDPVPRHMDTLASHYAIIGMAHVADNYPLYYDAMDEEGLGSGINFVSETPPMQSRRMESRNVAWLNFPLDLLSRCATISEVRGNICPA